MKLARFRINDWESYGVVEGDRVSVIQGDIFGEYRVTQASYPLARVKFLPPTRPTGFWAVGLNYAAHVAHQEGALDADRIRREASIFRPWQKTVGCLIGHEDQVVLPADSDYVHYEGELVIVIGKPTRRVTPEEAPNFIFGYTVGNDISSEGSWSPDGSKIVFSSNRRTPPHFPQQRYSPFDAIERCGQGLKSSSMLIRAFSSNRRKGASAGDSSFGTCSSTRCTVCRSPSGGSARKRSTTSPCACVAATCATTRPPSASRTRLRIWTAPPPSCPASAVASRLLSTSSSAAVGGVLTGGVLTVRCAALRVEPCPRRFRRMPEGLWWPVAL
ncbi:MAG: fumarylacetoacetate hydrolase family protein [SAR324 cluster bacterium]|nr:fumarylacetoacetate hydrolase family protein [SAR324 cluster bacterium]